MSIDRPDATTSSTERRITRLEIELERRETFAGYARLYGGAAVAGLFLLFLPILEDVVEKEDGYVSGTPYGTLWEMAGAGGGGDPAVLGIVLAAAWIGLLAYAAFRPHASGPPIGIAVVAALILLMLIVRPGTGEPVPDLTAEGHAAFAMSVGIGLLAIVHAVHYGRWARGAQR